MNSFSYFCGMKSLRQFLSFSLALVVLFVSVGWDVKFHYCTIDHELTGSFGDAAASCEHCVGHHHNHHDETTSGLPSDVTQFNAKCCCEDFDQLIRFTDNFVFSSEKNIDFQLQPSGLIIFDPQDLRPRLQQVFQHFTAKKIPCFSSCRKMLILFSSLRLNPLVF